MPPTMVSKAPSQAGAKIGSPKKVDPKDAEMRKKMEPFLNVLREDLRKTEDELNVTQCELARVQAELSTVTAARENTDRSLAELQTERIQLVSGTANATEQLSHSLQEQNALLKQCKATEEELRSLKASFDNEREIIASAKRDRVNLVKLRALLSTMRSSIDENLFPENPGNSELEEPLERNIHPVMSDHPPTFPIPRGGARPQVAHTASESEESERIVPQHQPSESPVIIEAIE